MVRHKSSGKEVNISERPKPSEVSALNFVKRASGDLFAAIRSLPSDDPFVPVIRLNINLISQLIHAMEDESYHSTRKKQSAPDP